MSTGLKGERGLLGNAGPKGLDGRLGQKGDSGLAGKPGNPGTSGEPRVQHIRRCETGGFSLIIIKKRSDIIFTVFKTG